MGGCVCKPDVEKDIRGRIDYFGNDVNQASRVSTFAHGGQIVIHERMYKLIEKRLDDLIVSGESQAPAIRNLGSFVLNGIEGGHVLFEVLPYSLIARREYFTPIRPEAKGCEFSNNDLEMFCHRETNRDATEFNPANNI